MTLGSICRCGAILPAGQKRCDQCRPKENRPNAAQRGYDHKWRKTRKQYLTAHPDCVECGAPATDVDHVDGLGPLAPAGHDWNNLRSFCHSHHSQRTARDQPAWSVNRGPYWTQPFVVITGPSGAGKSTIRLELENLMVFDSLGPDDFPDRWTDLFNQLDASKQAIVECVRIHSGLRRRIKERGATVIHLTAPTWILRDRMDGRGDPADMVQARINETFETGYDHEIEPDLTLDVSESSPATIALKIAAFVTAQHAWPVTTPETA